MECVKLTAALTVSALLFAGSLSAQDRPRRGKPVDLGDLSLEQLLDITITAASRVAETTGEAPATVYVITKRDIRVRGYSTLSDVLKDLPGMETVENYYSEQGTLVPVRGVVGNNKIVLLVNGMRVNPPGGEELMIRDDVSVRFADQIEVIYGPGSTLYGQDAISAVINIKTMNAGAAEAELLGNYGNDNMEEGFASFGAKLHEKSSRPISVTGQLSFKHAGLSNFRDESPLWWNKYSDFLAPIGRSVVPVRGNMGYNALLRIESKHASLQGWYRESSRSSAEGSGEGGASPVLWFVNEAVWRDRSMVVEGQHELQLRAKLNLHSIFTFNRYEVDPSSRYVFPIGPDLFLKDFKYGIGSSGSIEEKLDYNISAASRIVAGVVATRYDIIPKVSVIGGANPGGDILAQAGALTYYTTPNDPTSLVSVPRAEHLRYHDVGMYVEASHRLHPHVKTIAGVRVDSNSRFNEVPVSPRAAVIFDGFQKRLVVKYLFSKAYVAPAPYFGHNVYDNGVMLSVSNANLRPERATSNEVNVVWQDHDLLASASVYLNNQSDLLITAQSEIPEVTAPQPVYLNLDGTDTRLVRHSINLGSGTANGVDLSFRYNMETVSLWGSYSFVDVSKTVGLTHYGLAQISAHNVRMGTTWRILPNLSATPSLVLRSTPENLTSNYDIPGVNLKTPYEVNLNTLYTPVDKLDAFVTVRNLSGHHYALRGVAGPAVQEPFSVFGGLRVRF